MFYVHNSHIVHDANGNLTKDLNKGISRITYDWNNLPREVIFASDATTRYTYDASGRKLQAEYTKINSATEMEISIIPSVPLVETDIIDYQGDNIYRNGALERTLTPNGYIVNDTVYYYVKDYQGNVRNVVREDGAVVESNEYYPYGGLFSATPSVQPYKYGAQPLARRSGRCNVGRMPVATTKTTFGNELDRTHGLDWYDSKARFYDSVLLRTNSIDKKAGDYTWLSPYSWCAGNPIHFTDPTGKFLLENFDNDDFVYCTVAIFPTNRDNVLQKDYDAAYNAGVPIICVDNVEDLKSGLEMLNNLNISSETFTINSHGESGSFSIGDDRIFCTSDLSSLNTYFYGKTVFIGACNVGVGQLGALITKNLSSMFDASVITSQHPVSAGYDYRGGSGLSKSSYLDNNKFLISSSGGNAIKISDVAVHKNYGIKWNVVGTRNWSIYSNSKTRNKW